MVRGTASSGVVAATAVGSNGDAVWAGTSTAAAQPDRPLGV